MKVRKMVMWLSAALVGLVVSACASDEPAVSPQTPDQRISNRQYRKTVDEALTSADRMFALIDKQAKTRSPRSVESIQVIGNGDGSQTRGGDAGVDTMLYLVNYADNQGFALLSSDWRTKPIYAISDEGTLNLSDTVFNKGLALFMENAREDYDYMVFGPGGSKYDSIGIINPGINKPDFPIDDYKEEVLMDVKPILGQYPSRWHQEYPFNKYCPGYGLDRCYVGCTAIALTQLLSVEGKPINFEGRTFDWEAIKKANYANPYTKEMDDLAYFMAAIGLKYMDMDYLENGSYAKFGKIHSMLCHFGLNSSGILKYTGSVPASAYPVAMCAYTSDRKRAHCWVLDGGYTYRITSNMYVDGFATYHYEHCVWGWKNRAKDDCNANGYYSWSKNYGFGDKPHHYGDGDDGTTNSQTGDYVRDFEVIYVIK